MADSAATSNASPGEILRGARELYGWSLEEVAAELNLLPDVVEALEADDYSHTAGWTYAVGYLRNYARLAGVSIEQAIADRRELLPPKEDGPGTMTEGTPNKPQPVPIQYRWVVTAVVLILVIGGLYAAYLNRASDVERVRVDLAEESRSQAGTEEAGESASTDSAEQAPSQPALAVTLTPSEEDGVSESTPTPAVPTEPSDADESPTVAATPEVPSLTVDAETATDSPAGAAAQTPASPSAPAEPEKKEEGSGIHRNYRNGEGVRAQGAGKSQAKIDQRVVIRIRVKTGEPDRRCEVQTESDENKAAWHHGFGGAALAESGIFDCPLFDAKYSG